MIQYIIPIIELTIMGYYSTYPNENIYNIESKRSVEVNQLTSKDRKRNNEITLSFNHDRRNRTS
jgi:hypothetical protein